MLAARTFSPSAVLGLNLSWSRLVEYDSRIQKLRKVATMLAFTAGAATLVSFKPRAASRRERYAEALSDLTQIFKEVAGFQCASSIESRDEIERICRMAANHLARAFSLITGKKCAVCIKTLVVFDPHNRPRVATLCRDDGSWDREQGVSPLESWIEEQLDPAGVIHWIDENTAFRNAVENPRTENRCYFSNNLPAEKNYSNTSFALYGEPSASAKSYERSLHWPLPYRSTIVAPIGKIDQVEHAFSLVGFLAVDSRFQHTFARDYDVELLSNVAAGLYHLVRRYQQLVIEEFKAEGDPDDE